MNLGEYFPHARLIIHITHRFENLIPEPDDNAVVKRIIMTSRSVLLLIESACNIVIGIGHMAVTLITLLARRGTAYARENLKKDLLFLLADLVLLFASPFLFLLGLAYPEMLVRKIDTPTNFSVSRK